MSRLFYAGVRAHSRLSAVGKGSSEREPCSGLVFSVDNGASRSFLRFDGLEDFESWYSKLEPSMRTLSEVVVSDRRKLVLDIDDPGDDRLLMYDFERHVTSRIHSVFFALDIGVPHVIMYSMCSDCKISYHAVVSNFVFSAQACLGLCAIISSGQPWGRCVDRGVYKRVQSVRIEDSTKFGEARWKERLGNPGPLRQGLLSDLQGTVPSDLVALVSCRSDRVPEQSSGDRNIVSVLLPACSHLPENYAKSQFRVGRPNSNGVIPLYRIKPGMCTQCHRVHERENAFIKPSLAGPVFVCWRYYHSHRASNPTPCPQQIDLLM